MFAMITWNFCSCDSFTPLTSRRQLSLGKESGAVGSAILSKKDGPIRNISDVRGKRIGVGVVLGAYQRGFQVLCILEFCNPVLL
jgi:hypothetical protein